MGPNNTGRIAPLGPAVPATRSSSAPTSASPRFRQRAPLPRGVLRRPGRGGIVHVGASTAGPRVVRVQPGRPAGPTLGGSHDLGVDPSVVGGRGRAGGR